MVTRLSHRLSSGIAIAIVMTLAASCGSSDGDAAPVAQSAPESQESSDSVDATIAPSDEPMEGEQEEIPFEGVEIAFSSVSPSYPASGSIRLQKTSECVKEQVNGTLSSISQCMTLEVLVDDAPYGTALDWGGEFRYERNESHTQLCTVAIDTQEFDYLHEISPSIGEPGDQLGVELESGESVSGEMGVGALPSGIDEVVLWYGEPSRVDRVAIVVAVVADPPDRPNGTIQDLAVLPVFGPPDPALTQAVRDKGICT